ncbi:hypothetical protein ACNKHL_09740 [Shigella flexneri]
MIDTTLPLTDIHRHLIATFVPRPFLTGRQQRSRFLEILDPLSPRSGHRQRIRFGEAFDQTHWGVEALASLTPVAAWHLKTVAEAARHGLHYVELRSSPGDMAMAHQLPVAGVVEAVIHGVRGSPHLWCAGQLIGIMSRTFGEAACQQELEAF